MEVQRVLLALALVCAVGGEIVCSRDEAVSLCVHFGSDWLLPAAKQCMAGEDPTTTAGPAEHTELRLDMTVAGSTKTVYKTTPMLVSLGCAGRSAIMHLDCAIDPAATKKLGGVVSSLSVSVDLKLAGGPGGLEMAWAGAGLAGSIDAVFLTFSVGKAGFDARAVTTVGLMVPPSDCAPAVPPVIEFTADGLPWVIAGDGGELALSDSCRLTALAPAREASAGADTYAGAQLAIPESADPVPIVEAMFDPCAALAQAAHKHGSDHSEPIVTLRASLAAEGRELAFHGAVLKDLEVTLTGYFAEHAAEGQDEEEEEEAAAGKEFDNVALLRAELGIDEVQYLAATAGDEPGEPTAADAGDARSTDHSMRWSGTVQTKISALTDLYASASGTFDSEEGISDLDVVLAMTTETFAVDGLVSYGSDCVPPGEAPSPSPSRVLNRNRGAVTLHIKSFAAQVSGTVEQITCDKWVLTGQVDGGSLSLHDVTIDSARAELTIADAGTAGVFSGTMQIASLVKSSAKLAFSGEGVTSFSVGGELDVPPALSGSATFSITEDNIIAGSGHVAFKLGNGALPTFEAAVEYAKTPTTTTPLWKIEGKLRSWTLFGVSLTDVTVSLSGFDAGDSDETALKWTGSVAGKLSLDGSTVEVTTSIENNAFQSLTGRIRIDAAGVAFTGVVELDDASSNAGCSGLSYSAQGDLQLDRYSFSAGLVADGCARAVKGEPRYVFTGTTDADQSEAFGVLVLTRGSVELKGYAVPGDCTGDSCSAAGALSLGGETGGTSWEGVVTANANLFGGSSTASVSFANGKFGAIFVSTVFTTPTQVLGGSFTVQYNPNSEGVSRGTGEVALKLKGAQALKVSGSIVYHPRTAAISFEGSLEGPWVGPSGATAHDVNLALSIPGDEENNLQALRKRVWKGTLTASSQLGVFDNALSIAIDTSSTATSVADRLTFDDGNVFIGVDVSVDVREGQAQECTGEGAVVIKNLPNNLQTAETDATMKMNTCGVPADGWVVTGSLKSYTIPFFSKTVVLERATVAVTREKGNKALDVEIKGAFADGFFFAVTFQTGSLSTLRVLGGKARGDPSVDSFLTAWSGRAGSALPASLGVGQPALLRDMKAFTMDTVAMEMVFARKQVVLQASGSLYGLGFNTLLVVSKGANGWLYGLVATAQDSSPRPSGLSKLLGNVVGELGPSEVSFSVASTAASSGLVVVYTPIGAASETERVIPKGLALAAFLGTDSAVMKQVAASATGDLAAQINDAQSTAPSGTSGLTVMANLQSSKTVDVFIMLSGNIKLGSDRAMLKTVALAFSVSTTGPPTIGFLVSLWFNVGKRPHDRAFTVSGFVALAATGTLTVALDADSPTPWSQPFGMRGVSVLFPLGVKMGLSAALVPTNFGLQGGLELGGTAGRVQLGADLENFANTAFSVEVANLNFKTMLQQLTGCGACVRGVVGVVADISLQQFGASFNPDPVSPVTVKFAGTSATIPAGIHAEVRSLNLWNVVKVDHAKFALTAQGMEASLSAQPVKWGPIAITAASSTAKGPNFDIVLRADKQLVKIDGKATVLGQSVAIFIDFSDKRKYGSFQLSLGGAIKLHAELAIEGVPGKSGFKNTIAASLKADIAKLVDEATAFLEELKSSADKDFEAAQRDLTKAQRDLDRAIADLDKTDRKWQRDMDGWKRDVDSLNKQIKSLNCKRFKNWQVAQKGWCYTKLGTLEAAKATAKAGIDAVKLAAKAPIGVAKLAVTTAKGAVSVAQGTVSVAQGVVSAFVDLAKAAGGALKRSLQINHIGFRLALTSSSARVVFNGDIKVLGKVVKWNFNANLNFKEIVRSVANTLRNSLRPKWGKKIPKL